MKFAKQLDDCFINKYIDALPPWGEAGYVTYKRTYARHLDDDQKGPREELWQTLRRVLNGLLDIGGVFTQEEIHELYDHCFNLRGLPSGRHLWQLGTNTINRLGGDSLQSCWHVRVNKPYYPFLFTFDKLMLGGGVGFNVQRHNVYELPKVQHSPRIERVDTYDCNYIVTDNREGWVELLERVMRAFFENGKNFSYNTTCIRERGKPIRTFGGVASGSEDLVKGIGWITRILSGAYGRKLRPVECMDIMNIIGKIVVAGNVRRSAEIACGDPDDVEFILAKNWKQTKVPAWRGQSNNTCVTSDLNELAEEFWWAYEPNEKGEADGEPYGLWNPWLCRNFGRLADGFQPGVDGLAEGPNPCGEITLEDSEACNLAEIYLPNITDAHQFHRVAELLFRAQKTISLLPFLHKRTNDVVRRNNRIGLGLTGWHGAPKFHSAQLLNDVYENLGEVDKVVSKMKGCSLSIKKTTMKPSGTLSLLANKCSAGANGAFAEFVMRRIQFASSDPMVDALRDRGYTMEPKLNIDGSSDFDTTVISFPISYEGCVTDSQLSAVDQMQTQEFLQRYWADNSVSMTVQYKPEEYPIIRPYLDDNYREGIKSISFAMHTHGFKQAPFEEITREQYLEYSSQITPLTRFDGDSGDFEISSQECGAGGCPVR